MDRIVTSEDEFNNLLWKTLDVMNTTTKEFNISIPNFTLAFKESTVRISYKLDNNQLFISYIDKERKATFFIPLPEYTWDTVCIPHDIRWAKNSDNKIKQALSQPSEDLNLMLKEKGNYYRYHNIFISYEIIQKSLLCLPTIWRKNKEVPSKKKIPTKIYDTHTVKLRNVYTINSQSVEFRNYETYTCECWGVRGHVRHLKDGREIFINPYRKGIKRNDDTAYKEKDYNYEKI